MSKLKTTVKVGLHPIREHITGTDNGFVFSDDIRDWQSSKKKQYSLRSYRKNRNKKP